VTRSRSDGLAFAIAAVLALGAVAAQTPEPTARPPLKGKWGGAGAGLEASDSGAQLYFDCGKGKIEVPIVPDENGRFEVTGRYYREGPGPTTPDQAQGVGARFLGQIDGNTLTLSVRLTLSRDVLGPYTLERNKLARIHQCG